MNMKDWVVPGVTVVFAAGISFASFESSAQEVEEIDRIKAATDGDSPADDLADLGNARKRR